MLKSPPFKRQAQAESYQRSSTSMPESPNAVPRRNLLRSLHFGVDGFLYVLATQRTFRILLLLAGGDIALAGCLGIERLEWVALLISLALLLIAGMCNTALESAIDLVTHDYHPLAKIAKDIAAGAVLLAGLNALAVTGILFVPRLLVVVQH